LSSSVMTDIWVVKVPVDAGRRGVWAHQQHW
jgi:hypothetical protein